MTDTTNEKQGVTWTVREVRARVTVALVNPESGYESETLAQVTADQWAVIDAVLCGRGAAYIAAPALLEACEALVAAMRRYEVDVDGDAPQAHRDMMEHAAAALLRAKGASS